MSEYPTELVQHADIKCLLRVGTSDPLIWKENVVDGTVTKHLEVKAGQKWLDCGACIGTFALFLLARGAQVYAIEPWSEHVKLYRKNLGLNGYKPHIFQGAVLAHPTVDKMELAIAPARGKYRNFSGNSLFDRWKGPHKTVLVPVIAFHELVAKAVKTLGAGDWNLKLDIEAAEIDILGKCDFSMFNQIYFEYHYQTENAVELAPKIVTRLEEAGFQLKLSKPVRPPKWWNDTTFLCWAKRRSND